MKKILSLTAFLLMVSVLNSCKKTEPTKTPTVSTAPVTDITATTATSGGSISSDGGAVITERGVCWSTSADPSTSDSKTSDGDGTGQFVSEMTGLASGSTFHVRAFATNSAGTAYGEDLTFTTSVMNQVTDGDGNIYSTITIGSQVWLDENLKATKYNDGTSIPNVTDNTTWSGTTSGAYCDYQNTPANSDIYGRLYNWYVVAPTNPKNVCPTGWHVPTDTEWATLITFLGGENAAGGKLKETGTTHWLTPNTAATNETGFTALPGGYRSNTGSFGLLGNTGFFWSATQGGQTYSWDRYMYFGSGNATKADMDKNNGLSVRCLKN